MRSDFLDAEAEDSEKSCLESCIARSRISLKGDGHGMPFVLNNRAIPVYFLNISIAYLCLLFAFKREVYYLDFENFDIIYYNCDNKRYFVLLIFKYGFYFLLFILCL